jgi:hypothetical protein
MGHPIVQDPIQGIPQRTKVLCTKRLRDKRLAFVIQNDKKDPRKTEKKNKAIQE